MPDRAPQNRCRNRRANDSTRDATAREARRGVYIDFEGFKDEAPALMGVLFPERFEQIVLDPVLADAARAKGLNCDDLETVVSALMDDCAAEGRKIFAFTRHELDVVCRYSTLGLRFESCYRDGHKIAKRWKNRLRYGDSLEDRSLDGFMTFIGRPRPKWMGSHKATKRLRDVRNMLQVRGRYESLTPTVKSKWTKLLNYNRADCEDLRTLVTLATEELEEG